MDALVLDAGKKTRERVVSTASELGLTVAVAQNPRAAIETFGRMRPALVVCGDGAGELGACARIRERDPLVAILCVSAHGGLESEGRAFVAGADAYLAEPFCTEELRWRIEALTRRARLGFVRQPSFHEESVHVGRFLLNPKRMTVVVGEREVFLTPKEFQILQVLASHCGKTLSANEIIEAVWGEEYRDEVAIPVYVRRIRDKIEENPSEPRHLKTRWGAGYYFEG